MTFRVQPKFYFVIFCRFSLAFEVSSTPPHPILIVSGKIHRSKGKADHRNKKAENNMSVETTGVINRVFH